MAGSGWIDELMSAKRKLDAAMQTGNGVASSKERIRNIMVSHVGEIVNAVAGISGCLVLFAAFALLRAVILFIYHLIAGKEGDRY